MERAPSPSPRMEKVPRDRSHQLRWRRVLSRKWLTRCSRKRSFCPPTFDLVLRPAPRLLTPRMKVAPRVRAYASKKLARRVTHYNPSRSFFAVHGSVSGSRDTGIRPQGNPYTFQVNPS